MTHPLKNKKVYSPTQAAAGAFIGGPLASVVFLKHNFRVLENPTGERNTLIYGALVLVAILAILPFLPERFPNLAIPLATIVVTRLLVEKYQATKESVLQSESLEFQSNWLVFGIGLACMIIFLVLVFALFFALDSLGILP